MLIIKSIRDDGIRKLLFCDFYSNNWFRCDLLKDDKIIA